MFGFGNLLSEIVQTQCAAGLWLLTIITKAQIPLQTLIRLNSGAIRENPLLYKERSHYLGLQYL